jgi:hypothetical protein
MSFDYKNIPPPQEGFPKPGQSGYYYPPQPQNSYINNAPKVENNNTVVYRNYTPNDPNAAEFTRSSNNSQYPTYLPLNGQNGYPMASYQSEVSSLNFQSVGSSPAFSGYKPASYQDTSTGTKTGFSTSDARSPIEFPRESIVIQGYTPYNNFASRTADDTKIEQISPYPYDTSKLLSTDNDKLQLQPRSGYNSERESVEAVKAIRSPGHVRNPSGTSILKSPVPTEETALTEVLSGREGRSISGQSETEIYIEEPLITSAKTQVSTLVGKSKASETTRRPLKQSLRNKNVNQKSKDMTGEEIVALRNGSSTIALKEVIPLESAKIDPKKSKLANEESKVEILEPILEKETPVAPPKNESPPKENIKLAESDAGKIESVARISFKGKQQPVVKVEEIIRVKETPLPSGVKSRETTPIKMQAKSSVTSEIKAKETAKIPTPTKTTTTIQTETFQVNSPPKEQPKLVEPVKEKKIETSVAPVNSPPKEQPKLVEAVKEKKIETPVAPVNSPPKEQPETVIPVKPVEKIRNVKETPQQKPEQPKAVEKSTTGKEQVSKGTTVESTIQTNKEPVKMRVTVRETATETTSDTAKRQSEEPTNKMSYVTPAREIAVNAESETKPFTPEQVTESPVKFRKMLKDYANFLKETQQVIENFDESGGQNARDQILLTDKGVMVTDIDGEHTPSPDNSAQKNPDKIGSSLRKPSWERKSESLGFNVKRPASAMASTRSIRFEETTKPPAGYVSPINLERSPMNDIIQSRSSPAHFFEEYKVSITLGTVIFLWFCYVIMRFFVEYELAAALGKHQKLPPF